MPEQSPSKPYGQYAIAFSLTCLSAAIGYFAYQLNQLDSLSRQIEVYSELAPKIVEEVSLIRSQTIPATLKEVGQVRQTLDKNIPPILTEVAALRTDTIPPVLDEIAALRTDTIPPVLDEVSALRTDTVPPVLDEVAALRVDTIPAVLKEVATTREELPSIIIQAEQAVETASQGAFSGFLKGIVTSPFSLVSDAGNAVLSQEYTQEDRELAIKAAYELVQLNQAGASRKWSNPKSGAYGTIELLALEVDGDTNCRKFKTDSKAKGKKAKTVNLATCLNSEGKWEAKEIK